MAGPALRLSIEEMEDAIGALGPLDYLGLTIHAVSRTLSQLQTQGLIDARSSRHVELRREAALADLCA